jgi:hypothetical protein
MLVRMRNGNVEDLYEFRARKFIKLGWATEYKPQSEQAILHAEDQGGQSACAGVEHAIQEQKSERAVIAHAQYTRTARSRG